MLKFPTASHSLQQLRILHCRKTLSPEEQLRKNNQERGLEGEKRLHTLLQNKLSIPYIPLFGLQLNHGTNEFQLDTVLLFNNVIHLIEVKNYKGDFITEGRRWQHARTMDEIQNPLEQLARAQRMLHAFLKKRNINLPVVANVFFMDPYFHLYGSEIRMPIIFPSQHDAYFEKMNSEKGIIGAYHEKIENELKKAHIEQSRHEYVPKYDYQSLQKGLYCKHCGTLFTTKSSMYLTCNHCGNIERIDMALLNSIQNFQLLFPREKITKSIILDWTGNIISKSTVLRLLNKYYITQSRGRGSYYIERNVADGNFRKVKRR